MTRRSRPSVMLVCYPDGAVVGYFVLTEAHEWVGPFLKVGGSA